MFLLPSLVSHPPPSTLSPENRLVPATPPPPDRITEGLGLALRDPPGEGVLLTSGADQSSQKWLQIFSLGHP